VFPSVFVVDDEHLIASTLSAILNLSGYLARFFTVAQEALVAVRVNAPDLLISDVIMFGLSGIDLAIQVHAECPDCKILLLSGYAETWDLVDDARLQGHDFELLQKPIHPSALLAKLELVRTGITLQAIGVI
jgi:DNA-binding NtrC family response regulator